MKKLGRKLILSAVALGAVATTAVSTTFAWYVSNSTVSASSITAKTLTEGSDSLQISADSKTWSTSATPSVNNVNLKPVYYDSTAKKYKDLAGNEVGAGTADNGSTTGTQGYFAFDLYFRNIGQTTSSNVYLKAFTLTNSTADGLPTNNAPLANIGDLDYTQNNTYTVDLLRVLDLNISSGTTTVTNHTDDVSKASITESLLKSYTLNNYHKIEDTLDTYKTYNAHTYYNTVKGITYTAAQDTDSDGVDDTTGALNPNKGNECTTTMESDLNSYITLGTCYDKTYLKVTFVIYEAGWDTACFDAVKGQTISLSMDFTSTPKSNA